MAVKPVSKERLETLFCKGFSTVHWIKCKAVSKWMLFTSIVAIETDLTWCSCLQLFFQTITRGTLIFKRQEKCIFSDKVTELSNLKLLGNKILLPEFTSRCCVLENRSWPSLFPKRHFSLSENNRHYFPHVTKVWTVEISSFSSHFYPKNVGDYRSS